MDSLFNSIAECCGAEVNTPKQAESPSLITTLKRRQLELKVKLSTINDALAALEQHPDVAKVIELVARSRW